MRTWILLGGLLAGLVIAIHEMLRERQQAHSYDESGDPENDYVWVPRSQKRKPVPPKRGDLCSICQDPLITYDTERTKYGIVALPCAHWYHLDCATRLIEYSQPQCPVCRSPFDVTELISCPEPPDSGDNDTHAKLL